MVMVSTLEYQYLIGPFESFPQSDARKQSTRPPRKLPILINDGRALGVRCLLNYDREYFSEVTGGSWFTTLALSLGRGNGNSCGTWEPNKPRQESRRLLRRCRSSMSSCFIEQGCHPGAMLDEVTSEIVRTILEAKAKKVLLPLNQSRAEIVGTGDRTLDMFIARSLSRFRFALRATRQAQH